MEHYLYIVESNCKDSEKKIEFNKWYNTIHVPDVLETKCFLGLDRYELLEPDPTKGQYIAVYRIASGDLKKDLEAHWDNMKRKESQGRISALINVTDRGMYRAIASFSK